MTATPAQVWASLAPDDRAGLTARNNRHGLWHLAGHIALIAILAACVASGLPGWWVGLLPLGIALAFLFTLQHECTHQTPFRTPWLNEVVGHTCALILIQPFGWFRAFHMAHHRFTNDPDRDPELQEAVKPDTWPALVWHLSSLGYWAAKARTLWDNARGRLDESYVSPRAVSRLTTEARVLIAVYGLALFYTLFINPVLIWVWLIPLVLGFPVLRLYLLAEHGRCPQVANMFLNSRTTLTNGIVNFLAWNMPYHAEHHAYPTVPFHALPKVHTIASDQIGTMTEGYSQFAADYAKTLR